MLPSLAFWAPRRWRRIWHLSAATSLRASITSTGNSPSQHEVLANMCSSWRQNPDSYPHGLRCFAKKASITPVSSRCGDNRESPLPLLGKGTGQGGGRRETGKMVVSVAPMVDVTGRHFRYLMRLLSRRTTLWTPMLPSVRVAKRSRREVMEEMLRFHPSEGRPPLVAQLGGDDPRLMLAAGRRCEEAGYGEVNINLGCPARNAQASLADGCCRWGSRTCSLCRLIPPLPPLLPVTKSLSWSRPLIGNPETPWADRPPLSTLMVVAGCQLRSGADAASAWPSGSDGAGDDGRPPRPCVCQAPHRGRLSR